MDYPNVVTFCRLRQILSPSSKDNADSYCSFVKCLVLRAKVAAAWSLTRKLWEWIEVSYCTCLLHDGMLTREWCFVIKRHKVLYAGWKMCRSSLVLVRTCRNCKVVAALQLRGHWESWSLTMTVFTPILKY